MRALPPLGLVRLLEKWGLSAALGEFYLGKAKGLFPFKGVVGV